MSVLAVALGGLIVGLLVGLVGVGGGTLVTPVMVLLGLPPSLAVGTDLLYATGTKLAGSLQHWRLHSVDFAWAAALCVGGVPGATAGSLLVSALKARDPGAEVLLGHLLGAALMLAALATLAQEFAQRRGRAGAAPAPEPGPRPPWLAVVPFGLAIGLLVGVTSVGSGSLVAPVLLLARLAPRRVVGTDIASSLLITVAASVIHMATGTVNYGLALNLMAGSVPGVIIGSRLTLKVPGRPLKALVSGLVLVSGLLLL